MTATIIWTIAAITVLGVLLAVVLYLVATKFKVEEDPRIDEVEKVMPGGLLPNPALKRQISTTISVR